MSLLEEDLLKMTAEITKAAVSDAGEKAAFIIGNPEGVTDFIQAVYDKLKVINDGIDSSDGVGDVIQF